MIAGESGHRLRKRQCFLPFAAALILLASSGCVPLWMLEPTDTPEPRPTLMAMPTNTVVPPPTDTAAPPPTDTATPPPADTVAPTATETSAAQATATPTSPTIAPTTAPPTAEPVASPTSTAAPSGGILDLPIGIGIVDATSVEIFNKYAREDDVISSRPVTMDLLQDVQVGRRMLNFNPRDEGITDRAPIIAQAKTMGVTLLGYNLETVQDPVELVRKEQELQAAAREAGLTYVFGPLIIKLMNQYEEFAQHADALVMQSQRFQTTPEYEQFVEDLITQIKAVNPDIEVWVMVSVNPPEKRNVTAEEVINDIQLVADKADLIWIYFGPRTTPLMEEVFRRLRQ